MGISCGYVPIPSIHGRRPVSERKEYSNITTINEALRHCMEKRESPLGEDLHRPVIRDELERASRHSLKSPIVIRKLLFFNV